MISNQKRRDDMEHNSELEGFFWNIVGILASEDRTAALAFLNRYVGSDCVTYERMLTHSFRSEIFGAQSVATTAPQRVLGAKSVLARCAQGSAV